MSPVAQRYIKAILIGLVFSLSTMALGFLPYDDILQGIWVFLSTFITATLALRKRVMEDDSLRYTRLAKTYFNHWLKKDPRMLEGLFASNVPYSAVEWFKQETGEDLLKCEVPHVIDSWAKIGDAPGQLIFRSGLELGKMVNQNELLKGDLNKFLSQKFKELAESGKDLLGEEIAPKVFFKELKDKEYRPVGIHISNSYSECLALCERQEVEDEVSVLNKVSIGFKKEYLENLEDAEWEKIKQNIIYKYFPFFKPISGGSGPQKKLIPLFLTEKLLSEQELKDFPQKVVKAYEEVKKAIEVELPEKEDENENEKKQDTSGE